MRLAIRSDRQSNSKDRAAAECAMRLDRAAMQVHDPMSDREAQAGAAGFAGASLIRSKKALEDVRQIFFADADSAVANLDAGGSGPIGKVHSNLAARGRVLHSVFKNDQQETLDRSRIPGNPNRTGCKLACDLDSLGGCKNTSLL